MLAPCRWLLANLALAAVFLSATEGAGLGLVFLLLGSSISGGAVAGRRWLAGIGPYLQSLTVAQHIRIAALSLLGLTLIRCLLQYWQHLQTLRLRRLVERNLQIRVFERLHNLGLGTLQREQGGSLLVMLNQYPQKIGELSLNIGRSLASIVLVISYGLLALTVSWQLSLVSATLLASVAWVLRPWVRRRLRWASERNRQFTNAVNNVSAEHVPAMRLIRNFDRSAWSKALFKDKLEAAYAFEYRAGAVAGLANPAQNLLNTLVFSSVLIASASFLRGTPQAIAAQLGVFLVIAFRMMGSVGTIADLQTMLLENGPVLDALFDFLAPLQPAQACPQPGPRRFTHLRDGVALEHVTFRYRDREAPSLKDVSIEIPRGKLTAIVGPSGSGKSTIAALVCRLYDPEAGSVRIDGTDIREFDTGTWRRRMAVAGQDLPLFHATVRENLLFGKPDATEAQLAEACRLAQASDFIAALPQGYETVLLDRGMRLSGGQRQRIVLARALLVDPDLLILDEATSDLDVLTERAIHDALLDRLAGKTVLAIAHRLSTIEEANQIHVIDAGRVVESGTHLELLALDGLYSRMIRSQAHVS